MRITENRRKEEWMEDEKKKGMKGRLVKMKRNFKEEGWFGDGMMKRRKNISDGAEKGNEYKM